MLCMYVCQSMCILCMLRVCLCVSMLCMCLSMCVLCMCLSVCMLCVLHVCVHAVDVSIHMSVKHVSALCMCLSMWALCVCPCACCVYLHACCVCPCVYPCVYCACVHVRAVCVAGLSLCGHGSTGTRTTEYAHSPRSLSRACQWILEAAYHFVSSK